MKVIFSTLVLLMTMNFANATTEDGRLALLKKDYATVE